MYTLEHVLVGDCRFHGKASRHSVLWEPEDPLCPPHTHRAQPRRGMAWSSWLLKSCGPWFKHSLRVSASPCPEEPQSRECDAGYPAESNTKKQEDRGRKLLPMGPSMAWPKTPVAEVSTSQPGKELRGHQCPKSPGQLDSDFPGAEALRSHRNVRAWVHLLVLPMLHHGFQRHLEAY